MSELWLLFALLAAPDGGSGEACAGCHAEQAAEHRDSRHRVAWTNAIFSAEYDEHPKAWCVTCHGPDVAPADRAALVAEQRGLAIAEAGVSCASCHKPRGGGADVRARRRRATSIHATEIDPGFGGADDCGGCHQFNFPILGEAGRLIAYTDEPMQNTSVEARGADCLACHGDHRFAGSHTPAMVRDALAVELCADRSRGALTLRITNRGAAHKIPSGGVNRFMVARLWRSSSPERLVERRIGRRFARPGASPTKRTVEDTAIAAGRSAVITAPLAALGGAADEPVNAELRYIYMSGPERLLGDGTRTQAVIDRRRVRPTELSGCPPRLSAY